MKNVIVNVTMLLLLFLSISCFNSSGESEEKVPFGISEEEAQSRLSKLPQSLRNSDLFSTEVIEPTKLFDNLYFVGYKGIGCFVVNTTEGIVLIDLMWTPNDAKDVIIPGIKKLGLEPANIKYAIITHGHSDHYGGASYIEENYGAKIFMSKTDWEYMNDTNAPILLDPFGNYSNEIPKPKAYVEVEDNQKITLGNTTITAISTPGHTPGCISLIIPVTEKGKAHTAALWGGTGLPVTLAENESYLKSLNYFESVANKANVDVEISCHPFVDNLLGKVEELRTNKSEEPNPLIVGNEVFRHYVDSSLRKSVEDKISSF